MSSPSELHQATGRALAAAVDAGVIGFAEMALASTLASHVRRGLPLTTPQARQAWRILHRHAHLLPRHGIELPGGTPVAQAPAPRPARDALPPTVALRPDGRIGVTNAPFAVNDVFKQALHARFDKPARQWHVPATPDYAAAVMGMLEPYGPAASAKVVALVEEYRRRPQARVVLDPGSNLPAFDYSGLIVPGASVWEHQARAIEFAVNSSAALWAIAMGGGKTATAVWTANRLRTGRVVIVCPNKVRGVWPREVAKWSSLGWHVVDGKRPARRKGARPQDLKVAERLHEAEGNLFDCPCEAVVHAAVFNYEMLAHAPVDTWVPPQPIDLVIYDEVHRLKSPTGKVSKVAASWVDFTDRRIGLTGTPMPQHPWDIFGVLRALEPGLFGPVWTPFKSKYIEMGTRKEDGQQFPVAIRREYAEEFAAKVHEIMYRPTVDLKLPGAKHVMRPVELEPDARREYDRLFDEEWADLSAFTALDPEAGEADPTLRPKQMISRMMRLMQFTGGTVPDDGVPDGTGRRIRTQYRVSRAKADMLAEFAPRADKDGVHVVTGGILDEIGCVPGRPGGPEPVVVYCQFRADLDAVAEVAAKAGLRYAEVSGRRSDGLTDRSEMNPNADVVGVQIQSGGTGVDLTRSCYGVWYSVGHSVGDYDQALKRQDRPGQTRAVTFIHLVAVDTVDEDVYSGLAARRSIVGSFLKRRGVDPAAVGLDSADGAVLSLDQVEDAFNAERAREGGIRSGAVVPLPTDEFAADVMGDPRARGKRPPRREQPALTPEQIAEFGLEGLFGDD